MQRALAMLVVLCGTACVSHAAGMSLESLRAQAGELGATFSQLKQIEAPALTGASILAAEDAVPGYGQLPHYLLSDPSYTTAEGLRVWRFYQLGGYKSQAEAGAVMNYWRQALADSGVRLSTWNVTEMVSGYYDYEILYVGDKYVEEYDPETTWASVEPALAAMNAQAAAIRAKGLTVVKALPARTQGQYTFVVYYLAAYDKDKANRLRVIRYSPEELLASESEAAQVAARDQAAFEKAGLPVLNISYMSGPNGAFYFIHFIGKEKYPAKTVQGELKGEAAAKQALADFLRALASDRAVVLESKVYRSGPWFEEIYSFEVRYLKVD